MISITWPHVQESNLETTVMVIVDPALNGGAGGLRPLSVADLQNLGASSQFQKFSSDLTGGLSGQFIPFPSNFTGVPIVTASIIIPNGQPIVPWSIDTPTTSGYMLVFAAALPANGYKANTIAG